MKVSEIYRLRSLCYEETLQFSVKEKSIFINDTFKDKVNEQILSLPYYSSRTLQTPSFA